MNEKLLKGLVEELSKIKNKDSKEDIAAEENCIKKLEAYEYSKFKSGKQGKAEG